MLAILPMKTPAAGFTLLLASLFSVSTATAAATAHPNPDGAPPHPARNPGSRIMLSGPWVPADPHTIDFDRLPRLPVQHAVISDVRPQNGVNQHNYLAHFDGRFWVMWSDGPSVEDKAGQMVKYSTSRDGLVWAPPRMLTGYPPHSGPDSPVYNTSNPGGFRYFSRGLWVRENRLLALVARDNVGGPSFGDQLELQAWGWNETADQWDDLGLVQKNALNNFPPQRLPTGEWGESRRKYDTARSGVDFLIGGVGGLDRWEAFPVMRSETSTLKASEPVWWTLPDRSLVMLFRDNARSHYLYRSFSTDSGRTWSTPAMTDFPDAVAKTHVRRLTDGRYVLVSNSNPKKRDPLTLAVSRDGLVFDRLFHLVGGRQVDYPHVLEHDGHLFIAFSGRKQTIEILRVRVADLDAPPMPARQ